MRAEKTFVTEYIFKLNKEEALYIKSILNCAPADLAEGVLNGKYTVDEIVKITGHGRDDSMWDTISKVI